MIYSFLESMLAFFGIHAAVFSKGIKTIIFMKSLLLVYAVFGFPFHFPLLNYKCLDFFQAKFVNNL